ncbi:MAG: hypothetical protein JNG86_09815 [Verrucomicrobiaceae bacterium]|nr:hypothetical protein [Verrucomicrobiaceae bacterium]
MKHIRHLTLLIIASILSSCAGGTSYDDVKASGALAPKAGRGMVVIYRTPGFVSAAYKPYLYANGAELPARLARGGFYSLEVPAGPLQLAHSKQRGESTAATKTMAVVGGVLFGGVVGGALAVPADIEQHRKVGLSLQVQPGQTHYVAMGGAGGDLYVVPREEAEEELPECNWLNPSR